MGIIDVFLQETCQAAVWNSVLWIQDLPDEQHASLDEILAGVLENQKSLLFEYSAHTVEEHICELSMYPARTMIEQRNHPSAEWKQRYVPRKDL